MMRFAGFGGLGGGLSPFFRLPRLRVICAPFGRLFFPASIAGRFAANTGRGGLAGGLSPGLFNGPVWPRLRVWRGGYPFACAGAVWAGFGLAVCWGGLAVCLMPGRGGLGLGGAI